MKILGILLLLFSANAYSFPENVRHGYFSCTTCHVSPTGAGVLTPYGRSLSAELMSTWGSTKTAGFLFSDNEAESKVPWFRSQVFLKGVQTYRNTTNLEKAQTIPMQADLEVGVDTEKWAIVTTAGFRSKDTLKELKEFFSRRHFVIYRFTDSIVTRAGKFMHSFGLNGSDHITATRRGLGWDQGSESYNLELNYLGESFNQTLTLVSNSPEERSIKKENGFSLNSSYFWRDNSRLGFSFYSGAKSESDRFVYGPFVTISLTEKIFISSEFFIQTKKISNTSETQKGYATFTRLGLDAFKGITPFIQFDRSNLNESDKTQMVDIYGIGAHWLPYPHFDLMTFVGKEKSFNQAASDYAWLMLNIYL